MPTDPNRPMFERAVELLHPLLSELVFVGGSTTGLLLTDPAIAGIRTTKDVDAIVNVLSYAGYAALSERLRALGLTEDTSEGAPLCRWRHGGLIVDVMPIAESVLGFSNRWYPSAIRTAQTISIGGRDVHVVAAVHFVATKLEAFRSRGRGDVTLSHDLEDVVALFDGRPELVAEVAIAEPEVRSFIASEIATLMANPEFREALSGFLLPDAASQARRSMLERRLSTVAAL